MSNDFVKFSIPKKSGSIIKVFGVGGGGSNAVNNMYEQSIKDVDFYIFNTDIQHFEGSPVPNKIQLGKQETEGLGAGNNPEKGRASAIESIDTITDILADDTKMLFIAAGMGGGTGTGAAPVIAKVAKDKGILTVGIVSFPVVLEGNKRKQQAIQGIEELKENVDSLLIINNQKIFDIYGDLEMTEANKKADDILTIAAKGIAEIITVKGTINVDFADVDSVMRNSGVALMCNGIANGENRVEDALKESLNSPLLNDNDIHGAKNILLNISAGTKGLLASELSKILNALQDLAGDNVNVIWGLATDHRLEENISITIIATGFEVKDITEIGSQPSTKEKAKPFSYYTQTTNPHNANMNTIDENKITVNETVMPADNNTDYSGIKVKPIKSTDDMFKKVDELDEQPAIYRKANQLSFFEEEEEVQEDNEDTESISRYTLNNDDNNESKFGENSYFDKKVD